jgi:hypothetical protein
MPSKKAFFPLVAALMMVLPKIASAQDYFNGWDSGSLFYSPMSSGYMYYPHHSRAQHDSRIDPRLLKAARIAEARSSRHSQARCWQYVKDALLAAGVVNERPTSDYAFEAASELTHRYGFVRLPIHDPYRAPVGSVLVYENGRAGHVEIRTERGFASDYHSQYRCKFRLVGVFAKLS